MRSAPDVSLARGLLPLAIALLFLAVAGPLEALDTERSETSAPSPMRLLPPSSVKVDAQSLAAIESGLRFLLQAQDRGSGRVGTSFPVATTALGGLAVLGAGIHPDQPPYDEFLSRAVGYLLDRSDAGSGFVTETPGSGDGDAGSRMHGHCYAVLFLTQVSGAFPADLERRIRRAIESGIRVIERSQSRRGGWWYGPVNSAHEDEASVTICAVQALRAARDIGYEVNASKIDWGIRYVRDCQLPDGSVRYSLSTQQDRSSFALTAAAAATLNAAGVYRRLGGSLGTLDGTRRQDEAVLRRALDSMRVELSRRKSHPERAVADEFFFYGNFYAAQALFQDGGDLWPAWYGKVKESLLAPKLMVKEAGHTWWRTPQGPSLYGNEYATAMALLILELPLGYLPIFQR